MCFGQLGAIIIRDAVSSGDGSLEIMIPGHRLNVIFCVCRLQDFNEVQDIMQEETIKFINNIVNILH
jgi:hypothetical protein